MNRALTFLLLISLGCSSKSSDTGSGDKPTPDPPAPKDGKPNPPTPNDGKTTFPPDNWTHKELAAHLEQKGIKLNWKYAPFYDDATRTGATFNITLPKDRSASLAVYLFKTAEQAKEAARSPNDGIRLKNGFTFGRFSIGTLITGDDDETEGIKIVSEALK